MQAKRLVVLCQGLAACALWLCSMAIAPPAAAQIVEQATPPDKAATKIKKAKKLPEGMTSSSQAPTAGEVKTTRHAPAPVRNASPAEIRSAQAEGKVWVNTDSGIYHK